MPTKESVEELRKIFLDRHKEWEAVNNPKGIASGEMRERWKKRIDALLALVHHSRTQ
jgi:hypothetical protein